jgi:hypothetical protein
MNTTIHLDPKLVPLSLRGNYAGRKFKAIVTESVTIPADAGLWDGGSRDHYSLIQFHDGQVCSFPGQSAAPWDRSRKALSFALTAGYCVVEHSIFCGSDMGLTFYVHPSNATTFLPAPKAELSEHEKIVLNATRSLKSSYGGRDRYQMACCAYPHSDSKPLMTRTEYSSAKDSLRGKGLLDARGAITVAGKNASK